MNTNQFRTGIASRLPLLLAWYPLAWLASVYLSDKESVYASREASV